MIVDLRLLGVFAAIVNTALAPFALADPLHDAAQSGDVAQVERLIDQGANIGSTNHFKKLTPLHLAAAHGHMAVVESLIANGATVDVRMPRTGLTPLFVAAEKGQLAVVDLLIQKGADVNAMSGKGPWHGWTPLTGAIGGRSIEVVELLIAKGADIDGPQGILPPIYWAARFGKIAIIDLLIAKGVKPDADLLLVNLAMSGQTALAGRLIDDGADVNANDKGGATPLHNAVEGRQTAMAELLIASGAEINAKDERGRTPLFLATRMKIMKMVALLKEHGAKADAGQSGSQGSADQDLAKQVRKGRQLSRDNVKQLELALKTFPQDLPTRARLLGFYFARSLPVFGQTATVKSRRRHILWLIRTHPGSLLAGLPEATIDPAGHDLADKAGYEQARALWLEQAKRNAGNTKVLLNAAKFVQLHDKAAAESLLKQAQAPSRLGHLYALGILGIDGLSHTGIPTSYDATELGGAFATKARAVLAESSDIALLVSAGSILSQYGAMMENALGLALEPGPADLAAGLLSRAQSLAPDNRQVSAALAQVHRIRWLRASSPEERQAAAGAVLEFMESTGSTPFGPIGSLSSYMELAKFAIEAEQLDKAEAYASKLLAKAAADPKDSQFGSAIHDGNVVLGRVALRRGNKESAAQYLIKAGRTPSNGSLGSFGPNMALAKELLEAGVTAAVIEYLELCKTFWHWGRQKGALDRWIADIKAGAIPQFGPNLNY